MHPCHQDDERNQVEAELDGCCLVVEELDGHLAQCAPSVRSAQQAHSLPRVLAAQQVPQVLAAQQAQCVQLVQAT